MKKDNFFLMFASALRRLLRDFRWPVPGVEAFAFAGGAGGARVADSGGRIAAIRVPFAMMSEAVGSEIPAAGSPAGVKKDAADASVGGGGEVSITELYRKHSPALYWVCMRYTRNNEDAEDMVHQVFVKVQQNLASFRGQSNVYTWMYRIAVNECIQMFRKRKFETDSETLPDLEDRVQIFPEREMDAKLVLEKIMGGTDTKTVEILFLLYLEGLKQEEVAEVLSISRTTINRKVTAFKAKMDRFRW